MNIDRSYSANDHGGIMPAAQVKYIVLHHTAGNEAGDIPTLTRRDSRIVSCHFYVTQDGDVYQFLNMNVVGYHAGESRYEGIIGLNKCSIGIEIENLGDNKDPYTTLQLERLDELIAYIDKSFGTKLKIVGHKDVAWPRGRKADPSTAFPLDNYKLYRKHSPGAKVASTKAPTFGAHPCHEMKKMPVLRRGDEGWYVKHLQQDINRHTKSRLAKDGDFGYKTETAVKKFQTRKGLEVDGVVGPNTWRALL